MTTRSFKLSFSTERSLAPTGAAVLDKEDSMVATSSAATCGCATCPDCNGTCCEEPVSDCATGTTSIPCCCCH